MEQTERSMTLSLSGNRLSIACNDAVEGCAYAFYVYKNGEILEKIWYTDKPETIYWLTEPGEYTAKVFEKDASGQVTSFDTGAVTFKGVQTVLIREKKRRGPKVWLENTAAVIKEIFHHRKRMARIARYDYNMANKDTYLGKLWSVLYPLIQIGTYWFVFGIGLRQGAPVNGHPYLLWMLSGLIPWFFINAGIVKGAASIYAKANTALRLRYPLSTIPAGSILEALFDQFVSLGILIVTLFAFGYFPTLYWLNMVYYLIAMYVFLTAVALISATLTMIARDFQKLINSMIRLLFFVTPILWTMDGLSPALQSVMKLNPILYLVDGVRGSFLFQTPFYAEPLRMLLFWGVTLVLLVLGCNMLQRFKARFLDML
ncbi:MAG: ABC transporter permease [Clostridia bacterium]|nr:ABC transporter permease [Clostridia bacterium]